MGIRLFVLVGGSRPSITNDEKIDVVNYKPNLLISFLYKLGTMSLRYNAGRTFGIVVNAAEYNNNELPVSD